MLVSPNEYAARRGVTGRAVRKAIESGRLVASVERHGGRWKVNPELADQEWERNTSPGLQREGKLGGRPPASGAPPRAPRAPLPPTGIPGGNGPGKAQAETLRTVFQAKLLELQLKRETKEVVPQAEVIQRWVQIGRRMRDAIKQSQFDLVNEVALVVDGLTDEQQSRLLIAFDRRLTETLEGLAGEH